MTQTTTELKNEEWRWNPSKSGRESSIILIRSRDNVIAVTSLSHHTSLCVLFKRRQEITPLKKYHPSSFSLIQVEKNDEFIPAMRIDKLTLLVGGWVCGVAVAHSHHEEEAGGQFDPLAAPEYTKASVEELEKKWSFEVGFLLLSRCFFACGRLWWCRSDGQEVSVGITCRDLLFLTIFTIL